MEIEFKLSKPLTYAAAGESVSSDVLYMNAPSAKNRNEQMTLRAMWSAGEQHNQVKMMSAVGQEGFQKLLETFTKNGIERPQEDGHDVDGIVRKIYAFGEKEGPAFISKFCDFLCAPGICMIGEERQQMTKALMGDIMLDDVDRMVGTYVGNFFASW